MTVDRYCIDCDKPVSAAEHLQDFISKTHYLCSAWADFRGYQEVPGGDPIPLFNVYGSENHPNGSTIDGNAIFRLGVRVPNCPSFNIWKRSGPWHRL